MHSSFRRVLVGSIFFGLTLVIAITGYRLAGWSLLDAVYMVVITIFGVGYGEVQPINTPALRVFTMAVIISGTTSAVYTVGGFFQMVTEGEIYRVLGERRMAMDIAALQDHVIICGFGRIGQILARKMLEAKMPFVIVELATDATAEAETLGYLVVSGDATDEAVLQAAGIERARVLATVLSDDAFNVFITLTARGLNPNLMILARGEFPTTEKKLRQAGADHVVLPAAIGALRMSHMITHPAAIDALDRNDGSNTLNELLEQLDVQLDELAIPDDSPLIGGVVSDIELSGRGTFIVVGLRRLEGKTLIHPPQNTPILEGDTLIIMGHRGDIPNFANQYTLKREMRYRGARF